MADLPQLIQSFVAVTNASPYLAEQYLARNGHDLTNAIEDFYSRSRATPQTSAGPKHGGVRTLRDLANDAGSDADDSTDTNFYTGGEKSGLQVENPDKEKKQNNQQEPSLVERIFQRAEEQMGETDDRPSARAEPQQPATFSGTGFRLGDSSSPSASEIIRDPHANVPHRPAKVNREITFWRSGFTVADGPLRRYDDPENEALLQELRQGRVPVSLLGVEFGQDVDVSVVRRVDEDYTPPKRPAGGFHGAGQRLGSPVPGEDAPGGPQIVDPAHKQNDAPKPSSGSGIGGDGDGDSLVQIRFASGKRTSHRFHSSDPISAVYAFVRAHDLNDDRSRPFVLSHTFPVAPIDEADGATVASAKLKNAVIVQRWK